MCRLVLLGVAGCVVLSAGSDFDQAQASLGYLATRRLTLRVISEIGRDSYPVAVNSISRDRDEVRALLDLADAQSRTLEACIIRLTL